MTPDDLEAIRRRVEAATAAPNGWDAGVQETTNLNWHDHVLVPAIGKPYRFRPADVALFAHAPTDLRALLAEVERLRKIEEAAKALADETRFTHWEDYAMSSSELVCDGCGARVVGRVGDNGRRLEHTEDCPVEALRAALGGEP